MPLRIFPGGDNVDVTRDPREIQRNQSAEQMTAVHRTHAVGDQKIENDSGPQSLRHSERCAVNSGETLESEHRIGWQYQPPYLAQVVVGQPESLQHGCNFSRSVGACLRWERHLSAGGGRNARTLPESRLGFNVGKE